VVSLASSNAPFKESILSRFWPCPEKGVMKQHRKYARNKKDAIFWYLGNNLSVKVQSEMNNQSRFVASI
jgi:hypothetical protein